MLELTIVIAALLALVSILFVGARAWKRGSDRSGCIMNLYNMQMATRSYQNMYGYDYGGHPYAENGTQNIAIILFTKGYIEQHLYDEVRGVSKCPAGGSYFCAVPDLFPDAGHLYMTCSLSVSDDHSPTSHLDW